MNEPLVHESDSQLAVFYLCVYLVRIPVRVRVRRDNVSLSPRRRRRRPVKWCVRRRVFGQWRFVPALGVVLLADRIAQQRTAFFYRTTIGTAPSSSPPPSPCPLPPCPLPCLARLRRYTIFITLHSSHSTAQFIW